MRELVLPSEHPEPGGKVPVLICPALMQLWCAGSPAGVCRERCHPGPPCSAAMPVPCKSHERLPCCLYPAAPSQSSFVRPWPWLETTCSFPAHCSALCPPGCNSLPCSLGKLFPSLVHHSTPTAGACVTFFPFFIQLPFRYLYSVLSCSPSGIIFLGYTN